MIARGLPAALCAAALGAAILAGGCRSTADRARAAQAEVEQVAAAATVQIEETQVVDTHVEAVIPGGEGSVAVVVRFTSHDPARAFVWAPIDVRLVDRSGAIVAQTNVAGADPALIHVPSIGPGEEGWYVNDQLYPPDPGAVDHAEVTLGGTPVALSAPLGRLTVTGARLVQGDFGPGFTATVRNTTGIRQEQVVVQAVVRRRGAIVAAGTAVVPGGLDAGEEATVEGFVQAPGVGGELEVLAPASNAAGAVGSPPVEAAASGRGSDAGASSADDADLEAELDALLAEEGGSDAAPAASADGAEEPART